MTDEDNLRNAQRCASRGTADGCAECKDIDVYLDRAAQEWRQDRQRIEALLAEVERLRAEHSTFGYCPTCSGVTHIWRNGEGIVLCGCNG